MSKTLIDKILAGEFDGEPVQAAEDVLVDATDDQTAEEPAEQVSQYVEKPKQSKVRKVGVAPDAEEHDDPKQATTKEPATETRRRGAPFKLASNINEVCSLYEQGVAANVIADKFGVSVSCVINSLKRNGIAIRSKGRRKSS